MMNIKIINFKFNKNKKREIIKRIKLFMKKENIPLSLAKEILLDWTPRKTVNTYGGYYGGFLSLYNENKIYINLTVFYELDNLNDTNQVLWAIFHELIHCKQMLTKEIVISKDCNQLIYKGKSYRKLHFRGKKFMQYYKEDRYKATAYHIQEIPWEGECYYKSDINTGIQSFDHNVYLNRLI